MAAAIALTAGAARGQSQDHGPRDSGPMNHPYSGSANMLLPRGSDMYDEAVGLQRRANAPKPTADEQMLATGMEACAGISSLSPGAEMKCEIRAHQMAVKPGK